jgi:hypothetical protein
MEQAWTGRVPANRSPAIGALRLDGRDATQAVTLAPGQSVIARVPIGDPDGDAVAMRWAVREESAARTVGGDHEDLPAAVELAFTGFVDGATARDPQPVHGARFTAPARPGPYRLFVEAHDGHGHAAYANLPFLVTP